MIKINDKLQLQGRAFKNRLIVPPMSSQTANPEGFVTDSTLNHYSRLASSGASMVLVEYSYISIDGKSELNQLAIDAPDKLKGLSLLAEQIKQVGAIAGIQLVHSGSKTTKELTSGKLIAPSSIPVPVKGDKLETPTPASIEDIEVIKRDFLMAAKLAIKAGFDVIEIHAAHGYGINQWLSPITNQRSDQFGGSLYNRARILFEIVQSIKSFSPTTILSVRIPGQDYIEGGSTNCDSILLSQKLVTLGVDIINVSSGIGGWRRPRNIKGEGYLVEDARSIQKHVSIPVIGVGGIKTKKYIEDNLNNGSFSFAAIGRAILESPKLGLQILSN